MAIEPNAPVFVLGMPRCRSAWLSVCLMTLGCNVLHEGLRDYESFEAWADDLNGRLAQGPAGDANPALVYWIDQLLARWPEARFIVLDRDEAAALQSFIAAAPEQEMQIRHGWNSYLAACKIASDRLRASAAACRFFRMEELEQDARVLDLMEFATGARPPESWARRMQRLRVTARLESLDDVVAPPPPETICVPALNELDTSHLSAVAYRNADYETVADWWRQHTGQILPQAALPPLGVIVKDEHGPAAALWCYECYGVPVAELAFPVSRPGQSLKRASTALCYAVAACIAAAGKAHLPEASFRLFKTFAPPALARYLKRLGFRDALTKRVAMTLSL